MTVTEPLDASERAAILAEFDQLVRPQTINYSPLGWPIMIGALLLQGVLVWGLSKLGITLSAGGRIILLVATGAVALVGLGFLLLGGSAVRSVPAAAAEAALQTLESGAAQNPETRRHAAVVLLDRAYTSGGPWTLATFDPAEAARRLGEQLPYVRSVEQVLRTERGLWAVFSSTEQS